MSDRNHAHFYVEFENYLKENPNGKVTDLEFRQRYALSEIEHLRLAFEGGERVALMKAIYHCASNELPLPIWVSTAYIRAIADVFVFAKHKSWDSVFGSAYPKGAHLNAIRKERRLKSKVYDKVESLSQRGEAISGELFELIGKELGICKTLVSEYYYSQKRELDEFQEILKNSGNT